MPSGCSISRWNAWPTPRALRFTFDFTRSTPARKSPEGRLLEHSLLLHSVPILLLPGDTRMGPMLEGGRLHSSRTNSRPIRDWSVFRRDFAHGDVRSRRIAALSNLNLSDPAKDRAQPGVLLPGQAESRKPTSLVRG